MFIFKRLIMVFQEIMMLQTNLPYEPLNDKCQKLGSTLLSFFF